jgi:hypothetical protein
MSAAPTADQPGSEALHAAQYARRGQPALRRGAPSGSAQIASVVLPFLERSKSQLQNEDLRLDYGVRKFDIESGENWSVYFRVVNTRAHQASSYYIVDLSSRSPLIIMADSLDVGSSVRRREVWDAAIEAHEDVTEQVLSNLLDRAVEGAGQPSTRSPSIPRRTCSSRLAQRKRSRGSCPSLAPAASCSSPTRACAAQA